MDDYEHFFFSCSYNVQYWHKVEQLLALLKVEKHIFSLESLVTGYKIEDEDYFDMNYLLTIIYFSIYKAYYMSDKKDKVIDIFKIFQNEIRDIININKIRGKKNKRIILKTLEYFEFL